VLAAKAQGRAATSEAPLSTERATRLTLGYHAPTTKPAALVRPDRNAGAVPSTGPTPHSSDGQR